MESRGFELQDAGLRQGLLAPSGPLARFEVVTETGSTNADLLAQADFWPDLGLFVADSQLAGRGRLNRQWNAPAGSSLILSLFLRPRSTAGPLPHSSLGWLSLLAAVALRDTLVNVAGVPAVLKWPNDVLVGGSKVAGILAQLVPAPAGTGSGRAHVSGAGDAPDPTRVSGPAVVLGIGLNVSQSRAELPVPTATSLALESARMLERPVLLADLVRRFATLYRGFCAGAGSAAAPLDGDASLLQRTTAAMATIGAQVRAELPGGTELLGRAAGLDSSGSLLITDAQGTTHTVSAGDVVHLRRAADSGDWPGVGHA
ncbi:MAG TPA: biotin--[acetyl-CoA-carboxylase] ligase [Micrococcaceae bacterium]